MKNRKHKILELLILLLFIIFVTSLNGQKQGNIWYYGEGNGLDFNNDPPTPLYDGRVEANPMTVDENIFAEGSSVISDDNGRLLFYSDGEHVWNRNHILMPNGRGLAGMYSSTNPAFIIPKPETDSLFYVFTTDGLERNLEGGLSYSVVDMCLDSGCGDVVSSEKNIKLLDLATEKIASASHSNGEDVWVVAHEYNSNLFYTYLVTQNGIQDPIISSVGTPHDGISTLASIGGMKISPDGKRLALNVTNRSPNITELFDFNDNTGKISNPILLNISDQLHYGIEFSPNSKKLYTTALSGIFQYNLDFTDPVDINSSRTNVNPGGQNCAPRGMQIGPDGKIYVKGCSSRLDVIQNPNLVGIQCDYNENSLGVNSSFSFPSFIAGYKYNNKAPKCILPENNFKLCVDGIDNDDDGDIDCNDSECIYIVSVEEEICEGETYQGYDTEGRYIDTFIAESGCDSIRTLDLYIDEKVIFEMNQSICNGMLFEGYDFSGIYIDTFPKKEGCDSVRILYLNVMPLEELYEVKNICNGESYKGYGIAGIYPDTILSSEGCDTILEIDLKVFPASTIYENVIIREGESYEGYTETGIYMDTITSNFHCHVIEVLNLEVKKLYIPNAFSPNDDGVNDVFQVYNVKDQIEIEKFEIFDRWGNLIISDANRAIWDGTLNGQHLENGTYQYLIKLEINGNYIIESGTITLIR